MKAIKSVKQVFESDNVIITSVLQGKRNRVRIDARTRFHVPDLNNFFSEWVSLLYANRLSMERYGKKVTQLKYYNS